ncbi:MAG: hypothetical protein ACO2O6_06300 [Candidatus Hydrothermia bacterium]|jgi:hypothetical protein
MAQIWERSEELESEIQHFVDELEFDPRGITTAIVVKGSGQFQKTPFNQVFSIKNNASEDKTIEGFLARHYNNPPGVEIRVGGVVRSNSDIVAELQTDPVEVAGIQLRADPAVLSGLAIGISTKTLWGASSSNLITPLAFRDSKDFDAGIVLVPSGFILNGKTGLDFVLPRGQTIDFVIFVRAVQSNDILLKEKMKREIGMGTRRTAPIRPAPVRPAIRPGASFGYEEE